MGRIALATLTVVVVSMPLALSVWALLDAARRPRWVWAFVERNQVTWMALIMFGAFILPLGLFISIRYLRRIRPGLDDVEAGRL